MECTSKEDISYNIVKYGEEYQFLTKTIAQHDLKF